MNAEFMAAADRVQSRVEAALGVTDGEFEGEALIGTDVTADVLVRVLIGDLFEPAETDIVLQALQLNAHAIIAGVALGATPSAPIVGALAQMFATGYFYGRATEAMARP